MGTSFYGNVGGNGGGEGGGITPAEVDAKVEGAKKDAINHVIFSKIEPTNQKTGDYWFVVVSDND